MVMRIDELVSVAWYFDAKKKKSVLLKVVWGGRVYKIEKLGLYHTFRNGNALIHVFSVLADDLFFRLEFNSFNLLWRLKEVSDGLPE
jgi:hypothetical protein